MSTSRIQILYSERPPSAANFDNPEFFGGEFWSPIAAGDGALTNETPSTFLVDGGSFGGLQAQFVGSFTYNGDQVSGEVSSVQFSFSGIVFQEWSNLNWSIASIDAVVVSYEDGNLSAFDGYLANFSYEFIISANATNSQIMATDGDDLITAELPMIISDAVVQSFAGDDFIDLSRFNGTTYVDAGDGNDRVRGGTGADSLQGFEGRDTLRGGRGADNIGGGEGSDLVFGQGGSDFLSGGGGRDRVWGGNGHDEIIDHDGTNVLYGGNGNDSIWGQGFLDGGRGNDYLSGSGTLVGGEGNDTLNGDGLETEQVFDFRLNDATSFGNDVIETYDYRYLSDSLTPDQLVFDAGVEVSIRYQALQQSIFLTATLNGETIGTIRFGEAGTVPAEGVNLIIEGLQDDLVFL